VFTQPQQHKRLSHPTGTTVTVAIVTGWLLTVANAGDSMAILDTPTGIKEMITSHRIQEGMPEHDRLRAAGAQVARMALHGRGPAKPEERGVGPLRLWPGGLCVSRSVGDLDAGALVVPVPHIKQVRCLLTEACDAQWHRVAWGASQAGWPQHSTSSRQPGLRL
jgi:serine/threonine protein phosphatase PrpC